MNSLFSGNSSFGLLGGNSIECNKKFVVDSTSIVEECTHNFLDAVFASIIEKRRSI